MMYAIYKKADGEYACEGKVQDGTERWTEKTLEAAVKSMKRHAKFMNGTKIKRKHIHYFEPRTVVEPQWTEVPLGKNR
jgi:hypothetical protein